MKKRMKKKMKLYIVIPHYLISKELVGLAKDTIRSFKNTSDCIVVSVDDGSTMGTDMLKEESDIYIRQDNRGFAPTMNVGFKWVMKHEKDDCYIVSSNNDILVYEGWFDEFKDMYRFGNGLIGGLGYRTKIVEGMPLSKYKENPGSLYNNNVVSDSGRLRDWMFPGGLYMIKKSILEDIGLYDEGFIHGGYEDIDLFYRATQEGYKLLMTPKMAYWHKEGATRFSEESQNAIQTQVEAPNREYFKNKHGFDAHDDADKIFKNNDINL